MFRSAPRGHAGRRRLVGLLVLAWIISFSAIPSNVQADPATDEYNLAVGMYKQGRWTMAAERFRVFLKLYDKHEKVPIARLYLGLTLTNMEDYKTAREELRRFVADYPQNSNLPQARYRIGECSYLLDELPAARTEFEAYVKDYPKDSFQEHALPYLGDVQLKLNDPEAALATFQQSIDRFPKGALAEDARFGLGRALETLKRDDEAVAQFRALAATKGGVRAAGAQFHLGEFAYDRKKFAEAAAAYMELTKSFPNSDLVPTARLNAGFAYHELGQYTEAAAQFEAASTDKKQKAVAGYWLGRSLNSLGQYGKAIEALKSAAAAAGDQPLLESILFQQAVCLRNVNQGAEAAQLFETVLGRWPTGKFPDHCLSALIELAFDAGDLTTAEALVERFAKDFPNSSLYPQVQLLAGRIELARAGMGSRDQKPADEVAAHFDAAAVRFERLINDPSAAAAWSQARYYLAFTRQLQGVPTLALEIIAPVIEQIRNEGAKSPLVNALVLQADSLLAEKKFDEAEKGAEAYLQLQPQGRQAARAIGIHAVAAAQLGDQIRAAAALDRLNREYANQPVRAATTLKLAELADAREDWPVSAKLYEALIPLSNSPDSQPYAVRGLAWAQLRQKQPAEAAKTFSRILQDFPMHRLVLECAYYRAEALREAGQGDESIAAFGELLRKIPADKPAEPGAEQQAPGLYSFRAGLQAARMLYKANHIKEADTEFEDLLRRFPKPQHLDQILNEWALMNYGAQRYERSDQIFRRLISEAPDSQFVDNAKLNLAESELLADHLDQARQAFEELLASDKSDAEVKEQSLYQLLVLAVAQQRWKDVPKLAERLTTEYPESPQRLYAAYSVAEATIANPESNEEKLESAKEGLNGLRKLQDKPEVRTLVWFGRVWVLLAEIAFRQKKYDELEAVVTELRAKPTKSPFLHQAEEVLGRGYKQQAPPKFDEARKAFERVLADRFAERTETAAKAQYLIADTYFLQENWDDAFVAYQKVFFNYDFPEWLSASLMGSSLCDEKKGRWNQAAAGYRMLIEKFPNSRHAEEAAKRLAEVMKKITK